MAFACCVNVYTVGVPGASTQGGEWCEMHHGENWGECYDDNDAFARVYNNLLLHEYIYYFTPVHF